MSSLDRLIELARRTGDRLIVHDPLEERDIVIMDLDSYEQLLETTNLVPNIPHLDDVEVEDEWHSAGEVLQEHIQDHFEQVHHNVEPPENVDFSPVLDDFSPTEVFENLGMTEQKKLSEPADIPTYEPLPPIAPNLIDKTEDLAWEEEPIQGDEPVFYEEPV